MNAEEYGVWRQQVADQTRRVAAALNDAADAAKELSRVIGTRPPGQLVGGSVADLKRIDEEVEMGRALEARASALERVDEWVR